MTHRWRRRVNELQKKFKRTTRPGGLEGASVEGETFSGIQPDVETV